ncbi:hypothetical protein, partial [Salmonella enterica]|uniref:hypothetical protein n=1 Tax=Salmonella enterica TaxID=28901 RepID=UPI0019D51125
DNIKVAGITYLMLAICEHVPGRNKKSEKKSSSLKYRVLRRTRCANLTGKRFRTALRGNLDITAFQKADRFFFFRKVGVI